MWTPTINMGSSLANWFKFQTYTFSMHKKVAMEKLKKPCGAWASLHPILRETAWLG
jgi:hypothetical protein